MAGAGSLGIVAGGGGASGGASGVVSPQTLLISNVGTQSGSDWSDSSGYLQASWAPGTDGVRGVNQNLWDDILIWDLSSLFGTDILCSASPNLAMDWDTQSHPAEAAFIGFGFCAAANLGAAAVQTSSRWTNLWNNGSSREGALGRRNQGSAGITTARASPAICRLSATVLGERWAYAVSFLDHGGTGADPTYAAITTQNNVTATDKIFAWIAGGPDSAAVGTVTWQGSLKVYYGGGT